MRGRLIGIIRNGEYIRVESDESGSPSIAIRHGSERTDYFNGVRPSHLRELDNRQLYMAAERLFEHRFTGTSAERARAAEAYNAIKIEARSRRATLR